MRDMLLDAWTPLAFEPTPPPPILRTLLRSLARDAALALAVVTVTAAVLIVAYAAKRELGIDVVPGVDMLPDEEIRVALSGLFD